MQLSEMIWKDDRKETTYIAFAQRKEDSQAHTYRVLIKLSSVTYLRNKGFVKAVLCVSGVVFTD